jgi:hypothetical protein
VSSFFEFETVDQGIERLNKIFDARWGVYCELVEFNAVCRENGASLGVTNQERLKKLDDMIKEWLEGGATKEFFDGLEDVRVLFALRFFQMHWFDISDMFQRLGESEDAKEDKHLMECLDIVRDAFVQIEEADCTSALNSFLDSEEAEDELFVTVEETIVIERQPCVEQSNKRIKLE